MNGCKTISRASSLVQGAGPGEGGRLRHHASVTPACQVGLRLGSWQLGCHKMGALLSLALHVTPPTQSLCNH